MAVVTIFQNIHYLNHCLTPRRGPDEEVFFSSACLQNCFQVLKVQQIFFKQ